MGMKLAGTSADRWTFGSRQRQGSPVCSPGVAHASTAQAHGRNFFTCTYGVSAHTPYSSPLGGTAGLAHLPPCFSSPPSSLLSSNCHYIIPLTQDSSSVSSLELRTDGSCFKWFSTAFTIDTYAKQDRYFMSGMWYSLWSPPYCIESGKVGCAWSQTSSTNNEFGQFTLFKISYSGA